MGQPDQNNLLNPELSPDGSRVAVERTVQNNDDIWLVDGDRTTRFTFDERRDAFPIWSPAGDRIAFSSARAGAQDIYQKPSTGGTEQLLLASDMNKIPGDWSRDGRFITYFEVNPNTGPDVSALPLMGRPFKVVSTRFTESMAQFSPDGNWIAYNSNESGRYEVYVRPFRPEDGVRQTGSSAESPAISGEVWQISTAGGIHARWAPDGKELFYVARDGTLMTTPVATKGTTFAAGAPVALFRARIVGSGTSIVGLRQQYDVAHDGRFLINVASDESATPPITLLLNWKPLGR
jgi:Tol biopolymer transport system component